MADLRRTCLFEKHLALGAKVVEFGGWEMPVQYPTGIVREHLLTRREAGLFDVSHMGRFIVAGKGALPFLQHVLTNNAEALDVGMAQYTLIPNAAGGAIDDAYLYRFVEGEYLLVVNASNRLKDWAHLQAEAAPFPDVRLTDRTGDLAMLSLQGPRSRDILAAVLEAGPMPEPMHNYLSIGRAGGTEVRISRTGYTGEPVCFELFFDARVAPALWDLLIAKGAAPAGLGARDTLRLEAGLPLYGHELGQGPEGGEFPILSSPPSKFAVSFSPRKGDFIGRAALLSQHEALARILFRDYSRLADLPRRTVPVALVDRGIARQGAKVFMDGMPIGFVTSGTMVPAWKFVGEGLDEVLTDEHELRSIALACLDSRLVEDDRITIEVRGKPLAAVVVPYHLRSEAPPYARPILVDHEPLLEMVPGGAAPQKVRLLLEETLANSLWRGRRCLNLIPSEMTLSPMARLVSVMDPAFRYAEHRRSKAFYDADIFYYQGTGFIHAVERLLEDELRTFLGATQVETRVVSGQMANAAVFSALVDYLNRGDRKAEPRRLGGVMNHFIGKGGHLSAQPMGALRDFVARDPRTERPAAVNFAVLPENPYQIDVPATLKLIDQYRPELVIFGKSMVLHKEPVADIRRFIARERLATVVMYDMAHVLGLIGPHFQEPFAEGADLVTGSTHKTFFGTQRGVVGCHWEEHEERYELWEAVLRRTFPGSVSNHHLGTMVGLLLAAYEMNHFKDAYQRAVIANAKAFAAALKNAGLEVAGDPAIQYTETHQVIVRAGYGRGPEMAERLEANNIICNYQALPDEESFTAAGGLRMGVSEMTRFGMGPDDFRELAGLIADVVLHNRRAADKVEALRSRFLELRYCFKGEEYADVMQKLHELL